MIKKMRLLSLFIFALLSVCVLTLSNNKVQAKEEASESAEFFLDSSLFTHVDDETVYNQGDVDLTDFNLKLSNANLELYTNNKTGAVRIKNKTTNYIWASDILNIDQYDFNNAVKKRLSSAFKVLYRNEDGNVKDVYAADTNAKLTESVSANTLKVNVVLDKADIKFSYEITLKESSIEVIIKADEIIESGTNRLTAITMFPYLGAVYKDNIPGYIFLASGSGALVRYTATSPITSTYSAKFYGTDANISKNTENEVLSLPIYGICHGVNQNAMLVNVKSGEAFATLTYSPANIDQGFNFIYTTFNTREIYYLTIPGSEQMLMIPETNYDVDIDVEYTILSNEEANYLGMAKAYQEELISEGKLSRNNDSSEIDAHIEAFGRDYEKGLIFKKYKNMTTTRDIIHINEDLNSNGVNNVFYTLRAFNKKGYSNQSVKNYQFDRRLGSMHELRDLEAYFYYNPVESYNSKKSYPNKVLVNLYNEKNYIAVEANKYKFYANAKDVMKYTLKAVDKYDGRLALDGIGYRLYGDKNNKLTRSEMLENYSGLLGENKLPMYKPNYYFLANTSKYLNMPLYSERSRFVTDSVPFLQILLKGYIDYYSPFLNFSSNIDLDVLKCIEYGVNPAYLITKQPSYLLSNTLSSDYYATYYSSVADMIKEEYALISSALNQVSGATIEGRIIPIEGVSVVTYSNGKKVIVNYTNNDYTFEGHLVNARSYVVA
ncbi:MAG: hypothetical protein J5691_04270 [Bacilli bacterium]|nr:hypothetical protein [Bacilli bacterium]